MLRSRGGDVYFGCAHHPWGVISPSLLALVTSSGSPTSENAHNAKFSILMRPVASGVTA
jgi:hypothetical protein